MKETNLNSNDKFTLSNYQGLGVYKNTDELGFIDILIVCPGSNTILLYSEDVYNEILKAINTTQIKQELKEHEQNKVTEDFALKLVAIINNKEQFKDLK